VKGGTRHDRGLPRYDGGYPGTCMMGGTQALIGGYPGMIGGTQVLYDRRYGWEVPS